VQESDENQSESNEELDLEEEVVIMFITSHAAIKCDVMYKTKK